MNIYVKSFYVLSDLTAVSKADNSAVVAGLPACLQLVFSSTGSCVLAASLMKRHLHPLTCDGAG
jgi:hypothetical protein